MLEGQAKTDYQREYMRDWQRRKRGSKQGLNTSVRPKMAIYPDTTSEPGYIDAPIYLDADGNPVYED